jgi:hypothetical protein
MPDLAIQTSPLTLLLRAATAALGATALSQRAACSPAIWSSNAITA